MKFLNDDKTIRKEILDKLKVIGGEKNPEVYRKKLADLFGLTEKTPTKESLSYLGGFINGEGSVNVSIKILPSAKFGILIDPEFSLTQHINGVEMLFFALCYFKTGRISYKSGSNATMVYRIDNRDSLKEKITPFFTDYMKDYCPVLLRVRYASFFKLLKCFENGDHTNLDRLEHIMLPLWESMRVQDTVKTVFKTTAQVMVHVRSVLKRKNTNN